MKSFLDHIPTFRRLPGNLWRIVRPLFSRRLWTRLAFGGACLLTLAMVFHAVERRRWRGAWKDYEAKARELGVRLEVNEFPNPEVPDEKNFGEIPYFQDNYRKPEPPNGVNGPVFDTLLRVLSVSETRAGGLALSELVREAALKSPIRERILTPPGTTEGAARAILALLDQESGGVTRQLRDALARPLCRFPSEWYEGENRHPKRPPYIRLRNAALLESMRVTLHVAARDDAAALEDLLVSFRLANATKANPCLVAAMIRVAITDLTMGGVWLGLNERIWDDATLARIEEKLTEIDLIDAYQFGMETERALYNRMFQSFADDQSELMKAYDSDSKRWRRFAMKYLYPVGWVYRSQIKTNQYFDLVLADVDRGRGMLKIDIGPAERFIKSASELQDFIFLSIAPAPLRAASRTVATEALVRQARTACALERYRLKHGEFPSHLDALVSSRFLTTLPLDPISGAPMEYQKFDDDRFSLKSSETSRLTRDVAPWPEAWMPTGRQEGRR